ncbi:hypothetical protein ACRAWB_17060 [Leifsonia poae]|uniref:hypothetical protein n=1 Tax=Leifsonia poae TaxID=110933 RepID=UPI003D68FE67
MIDEHDDPHADLLELAEELWRGHYSRHQLVAEVPEGEDPADKAALYPFAFGIMACIIRSTRAIRNLVDEGFAIESRPIFRSVLDQILCLHSLETHGVHAVNAYGKQLAYNYAKLRAAAEKGFPLGKVNEDYIDKFVGLSDSITLTKEGKAAEGAIATYRAGNEHGTFAASIYEMWLETTPLSKPSMRLADAYVSSVDSGNGIALELYLDSDNDAGVNPVYVLATIVPGALEIYARIVDDELLKAKITGLQQFAAFSLL